MYYDYFRIIQVYFRTIFGLFRTISDYLLNIFGLFRIIFGLFSDFFEYFLYFFLIFSDFFWTFSDYFYTFSDIFQTIFAIFSDLFIVIFYTFFASWYFYADLDFMVIALLSPPVWSGGLSKYIIGCFLICNLTLRVIRSGNGYFFHVNKYQVWTYDVVSPITRPWDYHFCVKWQFLNVWAHIVIPRLPEAQKALGRAPGGPPGRAHREEKRNTILSLLCWSLCWEG